MAQKEEVVLDTNVLVSALVFPKSMGREIVELAEAGRFRLILPEVVRREVQGLIARDFPAHKATVSSLGALAWKVTPLPGARRIAEALYYLADPKDAPLLASVLAARPDYFVTNDITHFHTGAIKRLLARKRIRLRTPYGFLKDLGRR